MNQSQALDIIAAANSGSTNNFTGNGALEMYTGWNNPTLQYQGGSDNLLQVDPGAEPFNITVVNTNSSARSFYLSQGLLYTRGSESQGQLKTGNFQAINDTGTTASLTASTNNSITIEQFISYCQWNPTYIPLIQTTSTSATAQLATNILFQRQGMIKNDVVTTIPMRKYASQDAYNLQFQDAREPIYIANDNLVTISVAGSSTLSLDLYPLASKSSATEIRNDVNRAKRFVKGDPEAAVTVSKAISVAKESVLSNLNSLSSRG